VLQQTVKAIQRHRHEFLDELAQGQLFAPVTSGAVTPARAKLKARAFSELNRDCVLPAIYSPEHPRRRWRGHRLAGIERSLVRLPESESWGRTFGWKSTAHQPGATGTRYPEARLSVVYDVLNRDGWVLSRSARNPVGQFPVTRGTSRAPARFTPVPSPPRHMVRQRSMTRLEGRVVHVCADRALREPVIRFLPQPIFRFASWLGGQRRTQLPLTDDVLARHLLLCASKVCFKSSC
jgi:hypothetical protein